MGFSNTFPSLSTWTIEHLYWATNGLQLHDKSSSVMLWILGAALILIDISYLLSVPLEKVIEIREHQLQGNHHVLPDDVGTKEDPKNSVILDDKALSALLNIIGMKTPEETRKTILKSLQQEAIKSADDLTRTPSRIVVLQPKIILQFGDNGSIQRTSSELERPKLATNAPNTPEPAVLVTRPFKLRHPLKGSRQNLKSIVERKFMLKQKQLEKNNSTNPGQIMFTETTKSNTA